MSVKNNVKKTINPSIGLDRLVLSIVLNPYYFKGKGERKIRPEDIDYYNYIVGMIFASDNMTHSNKYKGASPNRVGDLASPA